jgi:sensor histidine kinase YesM
MTALISSPLLAIYGVTPLFSLYIINFTFFVSTVITLAFVILFFWLINIFLIDFFSNNKQWKRYLFSFLIILLLNFLFLYFLKDFQIRQSTESALLYPMLLVVEINTLILIICNLIILKHKKENTEIDLQNLQLNYLEAQKQVLIKQLQPHFLFNTLSTLKSLIKQNPNKAEDYSVKLSDFLRYSIKSYSYDVVTLEEELKFTNDYIELQKVRFQDAFFVTFTIPEIALMHKIPVYSLQSLVENAIKHNAFTVKNPLYIEINCNENKLIVTNSKLIKKVNETTGTGLLNLNKRYQMIAGQEIEIMDTKESFSVSLNLIEDEDITN